MPRNIETVVSALLEVQPSLERLYGPSRCIVSTRVAIEALRAEGIAARAVPVAVVLTNDTFEGALGYEPEASVPSGNWNGHLVCLAGNRSLVDLTVGSSALTRSWFGTGPIAFNVDSTFLKSGGSTQVGSTTVAYTPHLGDKSYLHTEDWNDRPEQKRGLKLVTEVLGRG